jgi:hypothetical protein
MRINVSVIAGGPEQKIGSAEVHRAGREARSLQSVGYSLKVHILTDIQIQKRRELRQNFVGLYSEITRGQDGHMSQETGLSMGDDSRRTLIQRGR